MKLLESIWLYVILAVAFVVFTFFIPIRIISLASSGILVLCAIAAVIYDERIQDPYSSIMGLAIFIGYGIFVHYFW